MAQKAKNDTQSKGKADKKEKKEKKEKIEKIAFLESTTLDPSKLDDEGHLAKGFVPAIGDGANDFNPKLHKAPSKGDFAFEADAMDFAATLADKRAEALASRAAKLRTDAENFRKYGDPGKRAKIKRRERLMEQLAKLDETLAAEGVDVEELDSDE